MKLSKRDFRRLAITITIAVITATVGFIVERCLFGDEY